MIDIQCNLGTTFSKAKPTYHFGTGESASMLLSSSMALIILVQLFVHVVSTNLTKPNSGKKVSSISNILTKHKDKHSSTEDYLTANNDNFRISSRRGFSRMDSAKERDRLSSLSKISPTRPLQRSSSVDCLRTISNEYRFVDESFLMEPVKLFNEIDYADGAFEDVNSSSNSTNLVVSTRERDMDLSGHVTSSSSSISDTEGASHRMQVPHIAKNAKLTDQLTKSLFTTRDGPVEYPAVVSTVDHPDNNTTVDQNFFLHQDERSTINTVKVEDVERNSVISNKLTNSILQSPRIKKTFRNRMNTFMKERFLKKNSLKSNDSIPPKESFQEFNNVKAPFKDQINVTLFDDNGNQYRVKLTLLELSAYIDEKVKGKEIDSQKSVYGIVLLSIFVAFLPLIYHVLSPILGHPQSFTDVASKIYHSRSHYLSWYKTVSAEYTMYLLLLIYTRFGLSMAVFFLLTVAERALKVKYIYSKYFTALTSGRRAKRSRLPHFRLHKVTNIKAWLSLRSYIKRSGPVRSVELIVSATLFLSVLLIVLLSIVGENSDSNQNAIDKFSEFITWDISVWKFQNHSELITEQINLYLKMEQREDKKDNLLICNNVLKLASKLLKDLEPPKKFTMLLINPFFVNLLRVIFLSFFSALISEIFGIRFKLWKIKA